MLLKFFIMAALGFGVFGTFMLLNKLLGARIPKWVMPVCIGLALIIYHTYDEYSWGGRTMKGLHSKDVPFRVVDVREKSSIWRPWTKIWPLTSEIDIVLQNSIVEASDDAKEGIMIRYRQPAGQSTLLMRFSCAEKIYALKAENDSDAALFQMGDMMRDALCEN